MATAFLDAPGPLAFAHRGGAAHAPENSWRAFEHAVGLGYRYLETDLQATADGVLVAFHDRTLTRVCGRDGRVCRLSYAELSAARIGGTELIPVLEDLLAAWPDVRFNLDVKDVPAIAPLPEVLRRTNAWDRVCLVSFSASRLRATRRALGRPVCMAASPLGAAMVRFGGPRGRSDRSGPGRRGPVTEQRAGDSVGWLARTGVRCVQVPAPMATPSFIGRARALGLQVHAWTVNDRPTMERLLDLGVDGIMTDETVALREVLTARGQWHPRAGADQQ
jgi:glycerophosphoryl diester phosphodiesterase